MISDEYLSAKLTLSGSRLEYSSFQNPYRINFTRNYTIKKVKKENYKKREDNVIRARKRVRQLIWANLTPYTKFLTLTTKEPCLDVKAFRRHLKTFFQAMRREGFDLKYLYVLERQKKRGAKEGNIGSIHAHIIIFDSEFIPLDVLNKCWHYGYTDLKILNGLRCSDDEKIKDVSAYVCKYITKEACDEWGQRCFNTSHSNLLVPVEFNLIVYNDGISYIADTDDITYQLANDMLLNANITFKSSKTIGMPDTDYFNIIDYQQGVI